MNILFLSLSKVWSIQERGTYSDILREFMKHDANVFVVTPVERRYHQKTELVKQNKTSILKVRTLNIQKTNFIEKGLGIVVLERQFLYGIRKYYHDIQFDMILYATPPITLARPIKYIKKHDRARTYLLLKDIFPQNAVDLGMMQTTGVKGLLYRYFRRKEKKLYALSDKIGCMSQANVDYLLKHNSEIDSRKLEVCPNAIEIQNFCLTDAERTAMRRKYGIPIKKKVFVYGGNLGKPQGIPFLIDCLRAEKYNDKAFFLIVGDGTEYGKIEAFVQREQPRNVRLMQRLPKADYDRMVAACDVGLIFLDHRFTIPNFPSRLLSYMQAGLPVLACTDPNTDIGKVIVEGGFGWWCMSNSVEDFVDTLNAAFCSDCSAMGARGMEYLASRYSAKDAYRTIMSSM